MSGITVIAFGDDNGKGSGQIAYVAGSCEISIRFPNGVGIQIGHDGLEMFADAFDDALGRRARKKKPTKKRRKSGQGPWRKAKP